MNEYHTTNKNSNKTKEEYQNIKKQYNIFDNNYRLRDFLKPSLSELAIILAEIPISLPLLGITNDLQESIFYATIPQTLTYLGFRAYELFGKDEYIKKIIRFQKIPFIKDTSSKKTKNLDELINSS